jgi:hypothetical protein
MTDETLEYIIRAAIGTKPQSWRRKNRVTE